MKPGYYPQLSNEQYHAGDGVSKSILDLVRKAPALVQWNRAAPRDEERVVAVDVGDALHALLLEPHRFDTEYVADFKPPAGCINTIDDLKKALGKLGIKAPSAASKGTLTELLLEADPNAPVSDRMREEWAAGLNGRTVLSAEDVRKLQLMRESVLAHPYARMLIESEGDVEPSIYWTDPETGLLCRCRPDKHVAAHRIVVDVKTTSNMAQFAASIEDYRYHVQDPFYSDGYAQHFGELPRAFLFLVVSTTRDAGRFPVRIFAITPEDREYGRQLMREDLATYAECQRSGIWPGIELITRPKWAPR